MKVLVVGGGGREHVLVWKLCQSKRVSKVFCAPGNAGTALIAENVSIKAVDLDNMVQFAVEKAIDLVVVAPDDPLAMGMVDKMEAAGIRAFGPSAAASRIEASKAFAKHLMDQYHIPTAAYRVFEEPEPALAYIETQDVPIVIKADGLALGKGVVIAQSRDEANAAVISMMSESAFGAAGQRVVIEQFLRGPELTVLAFTDGTTVKPMVSSRDHKRALDHDMGLNTGGMGAIAPGADLDAETEKWMMQHIFQPTIDAMRQEGCPFKGVIYFGLMLTPDGPCVIEYNARFGDPEAQVVLPLLETDLVEILEAVIEERLDRQPVRWKNQKSCVVVMASGGYPGQYETGKPITGLEALRDPEHGQVFHAGTKTTVNGVETAGGRVLGMTAWADTMEEALDRAYAMVDQVSFDGCHYRKDIGRTCSV